MSIRQVGTSVVSTLRRDGLVAVSGLIMLRRHATEHAAPWALQDLRRRAVFLAVDFQAGRGTIVQRGLYLFPIWSPPNESIRDND